MNIYELLKKEGIFTDKLYKEGLRLSAYLKDDTFLPCIIVKKNKNYIDLACKRFKNEILNGNINTNKYDSYREIVKVFTTYGNKVDESDIVSVEESQFAIPDYLLEQIQCETTMSWTAFVLEMKDNKLFSYGTSHRKEFFDLPRNYSFADVKELHTDSYVCKKGNIVKIKCGTNTFDKEYDISKVYREKPYFTCYID